MSLNGILQGIGHNLIKPKLIKCFSKSPAPIQCTASIQLRINQFSYIIKIKLLLSYLLLVSLQYMDSVPMKHHWTVKKSPKISKNVPVCSCSALYLLTSPPSQSVVRLHLTPR